MTRSHMSTLRRAWIFPLAVTLATRSAFSTFAVVTRGRFRSFPRREPINTTRSTTATALPIRIFLVFDISFSPPASIADERIGFYELGRGKFRRVNPLRSGALGNKRSRLGLPDSAEPCFQRHPPPLAALWAR